MNLTPEDRRKIYDEEKARKVTTAPNSVTRIARHPITIFVIFAVLLLGYAKWQEYERENEYKVSEEAHAAINALRKLQAATEVGVSFPKYQELVIEAKTAVNAALPTLPDARPENEGSADGIKASLKRNLQKAVGSYADAQTVWNEKLKGKQHLARDEEPGKSLIPRYELSSPDLDDNLQKIWYIANMHTLGTQSSIYK